MFAGDARDQRAVAIVSRPLPTENALAILTENLEAATCIESVCGVHLPHLHRVHMKCMGKGDIRAVGKPTTACIVVTIHLTIATT